jgi:hypothetical protein
LIPPNVRYIQPLGGKLVQDPLAPVLCANPGDQAHPAAEPGNGDCLIGSLPARCLLKDFPFQGFSRTREALAFDEVIGVHATDHYHVISVDISATHGLDHAS